MDVSITASTYTAAFIAAIMEADSLMTPGYGYSSVASVRLTVAMATRPLHTSLLLPTAT